MNLLMALVVAVAVTTSAVDREIAAAVSLPCEQLATLTLSNATITLAEVVKAGAFVPPGPAGVAPVSPGQTFASLPAFCRVAATLKPTSDSSINIEVWMPASAWNGKLEAVGNGGWGGTISYGLLGGMAAALARGYATASTDTGHTGGDGSFALDHPEQLNDFAHRAVHETTVQAKSIITAYYGTGPRVSYWNGCSTGGRQGLKEAQRYPTDYDGIIAGAPTNFQTHLATHALWIARAAKDPSRSIPREKYALIHQAVLDACDARDGVKDGVLEDPARCRFDPAVLECRGEETSACLTAAQVETARLIYAPAKSPKTGAEIFPGLAPGSETGWGFLAGGPAAGIAADHYKYIVFKNPSWDYRTLDFDKDVALADAADNGAINAIDPNLAPYFGRGGKLLMYHGWSDASVAPSNSINYYTSVVNVLGGPAKVAESIRLFMVPGMAHCTGGDGASAFDPLTVLEQWVEHKRPPERILASRLRNGVVDRTRLLCPYPQVAEYTGTGSTDDAANFTCVKR